MKQIPLPNGMIALVDDEDYERVSAHRWRAKQGRKTWYVRSRRLLLHRLILELTGSTPRVDHKDGNGLNNTRLNLRRATASQNQRNRGPTVANKSGYKGVYRPTNRRRWTAGIKDKDRTLYLGTFESPEDAARAYDAKARELYGEFARTNF